MAICNGWVGFYYNTEEIKYMEYNIETAFVSASRVSDLISHNQIIYSKFLIFNDVNQIIVKTHQ